MLLRTELVVTHRCPSTYPGLCHLCTLVTQGQVSRLCVCVGAVKGAASRVGCSTQVTTMAQVLAPDLPAGQTAQLPRLQVEPTAVGPRGVDEKVTSSEGSGAVSSS